MKRLKYIAISFLLFSVSMHESFATLKLEKEIPAIITRTVESNGLGEEIVKTEVLIDKNISRENLVDACKFLAEEDVVLTFESLVIGRAFLGLFGRPRIALAEGKIELPNGTTKDFKAGGIMGFYSIKIIYSSNNKKAGFMINTIEIKN